MSHAVADVYPHPGQVERSRYTLRMSTLSNAAGCVP